MVPDGLAMVEDRLLIFLALIVILISVIAMKFS